MDSASVKVEQLDHLVLTVTDIPRTVAFYRDVLGMREESFRAADGTRRQALIFGTQKINLHKAGAEFEPKAHNPLPGSADLCFLSDHSIAIWQDHLALMNVTIEHGPVGRTGARGQLLSLYLRDPDGNLIEIANRIS